MSSSSSGGGGGGGGKLRLVMKFVVLPYLMGWILSDFVPHAIAERVVGSVLNSVDESYDRKEQQHRKLMESNPEYKQYLESLTDEERIYAEDLMKGYLAANGTNSDDNNNNQMDIKEVLKVVTDDNEKQQMRGLKEEYPDYCWERFLHSLSDEETPIVQELMNMKDSSENDDSGGGGVKLVMHRNGDVEGCGVSLNILSELRFILNSLETCPKAFHKYEVESILTSAFHHSMSHCVSLEPERTEEEGFLGFCDMGEDKTPILTDHDKLIPVLANPNDDPANAYLPCHFHSREGVRITSFHKLVSRIVTEYKKAPNDNNNCQSGEEGDDNENQVCTNPEKEIHLYAVPAGRVFMFSPAYVGEIFDLPHIQGADPDKPVYMKVLSLSPRVFDIFNYFTREESAGLVTKAIAEQSDSHRIKRSSTGASGYNINTRRTSESGFDTHGSIAQAVKRRCFSVLGFDEYIEGHSDGLQILRYNQTKAYTAHMDWIDDNGIELHDYDSAGKGGNRFATILLYMTDLDDDSGGETVFVNAKPLGDNPKSFKVALQELRDSEHAALFQRGSWEEKMVAQCRSSLAIHPNSARAVLFYSQLPNGVPDPASLHGGCPVLTSEPKWAANLWVWNTPRAGFPGAPVVAERVAKQKKENNGAAPSLPNNAPPKKHVTFTNENGDDEFENAELFYEDQFWARLGHGDPPQAVNSYEGQVWNVKNKEGVIKKTFVVSKDDVQKYSV